jgi:hypothetical protein
MLFSVKLCLWSIQALRANRSDALGTTKTPRPKGSAIAEDCDE